MTTYAMITPSFGPDRARCGLLVASVERWVPPDIAHYLIIDRRDVAAFRPLAGPRTRILVVEDLVPPWIVRVPGVRRLWWSWRSPPIKNWILQQIVKLSAAQAVAEDVLAFVDSDVFFTAPFAPAALARDGLIPLFVETGKAGLMPFNDAWHVACAGLLGLAPEAAYDTNFIGNVICWRRANVVRLLAQLTQVARRDWQLAVAPQPVFSEYILYGLYALRLLDEAGGHGHYLDPVDRTLCYWGTTPLSSADLTALKGRLTPAHHSVMISAKSRTPVEAIKAVFGS